METTNIQLRKLRDFSSLLSDSLGFMKQERKLFIKSFLLIAGPFVLIGGILIGIFYGGFIGSTFNRSYSGYGYSEEMTYTGTGLAVIYLAGLFVYTAIVNFAASYLKAYDLQGYSTPAFEAIWKIFRHNFLRTLFYSILFYIVVLIGCMLCVIPGIYLAIVLTPYVFIMVIEEQTSIQYITKRCFALIRGNFWPTFGLYIIAGLIANSIGGIIGLIFGGVTGAVSYFSTKDLASTFGTGYGVLIFFVYFFFIIAYVTIGFNYYSRVEAVDGIGLLERVQQIGSETEEDNV